MLRFAVRNLLSRPVRSLLSLLGLTVAIVGMVGLFSVAEGIDATVDDTFGQIPGILIMQKGAPIPLFSRIPKAWKSEIEKLPGVNVVSAEIWVRVNVINGKNIVSPPRFLFGADIPAHQKLKHSVYGKAIIEGRYLNESDTGIPRTVISRQIAEEFNVGIGDSFKVNGADFEVVGIYYCGSLLLDVAIIVEQPIVRQMSLFDPGVVCSFYVEPTGEIPNDKIVEWMQEMFRGRDLASWQPSSLLFGSGSSSAAKPGQQTESASGNPLIDLVRSADRAVKTFGQSDLEQENTADAPASLPSVDDTSAKASTSDDEEELDPLEIRSAADWAERFDEFSADLDIFLTIMTSIGLTIAVLSIINTMLMSVSERIIEFGVLKANGWSRSDVMKLITCESAVLGLAGGICGAFAGWLLTQVINWQWPEHIRLLASPELLAFSVVFATILGIFGGLYPAVWATRMMPMDAIRRG
ncbi:MAG: ABC transporter permease [Planctomycetota bacterium]|nr:ABC transporter permease [Planctomycetota bacterium]